MSRKRNHQPRIHRPGSNNALPSFLLLGLMEHAGFSKPWYRQAQENAPLFASLFRHWVDTAALKVKRWFS